MVDFEPLDGLGSLTPATCRAGRALVDWTQEGLAERAGVGRSTIRDFEKGRHGLHRATERAILRTLWKAGVIVVPTGVMLVTRSCDAGSPA